MLLPRNSLIDTAVREDGGKEEEQKQGRLLQMITSMADPVLLTDPKFLLICASNTFGFLGFYVPFVYLPSLAGEQEGITPEQVELQTPQSSQPYLITCFYTHPGTAKGRWGDFTEYIPLVTGGHNFFYLIFFY